VDVKRFSRGALLSLLSPLSWLSLLSAAGCIPVRVPAARGAPHLVLPGTDGRDHPLVDRGAKLTVVEFFSVRCPCQAKHDPRLRDLATAYAPRGVSFVAVDSEAGASAARDRDEAARRGYPYPILVDVGGSAARALGAAYATYTVVVDPAGRLVYAGGIDSDKNHLHDEATPFLRDALDDALAGRPLRRAEGKALGCALLLE
jgi:hypothetical protein